MPHPKNFPKQLQQAKQHVQPVDAGEVKPGSLIEVQPLHPVWPARLT
jgi:hypothetical protein